MLNVSARQNNGPDTPTSVVVVIRALLNLEIGGSPLGNGMLSIDLSKMSGVRAACIQEVKLDTLTGGDGRQSVIRTTIKLTDKTKTLDMLMRRLGVHKTDEAGGFEQLAGIVSKVVGRFGQSKLAQQHTLT